MESRICQNCKNSFNIEPDDFSFYEKMKVPPPTFCPECRRQRRFSWRNYINYYKRECGLTGESLISLYSPDSGIVVYSPKSWHSDKWNALDYGRDYDFTRPFFAQYADLIRAVPKPAMDTDDGLLSTNCMYTNDFAMGKDCYLVVKAWKLENVMYSFYVVNSKDLVDVHTSFGKDEGNYETVNTEHCYQCRYVYDSRSCSDSAFCYDCRNCDHCFMSTGLRGKSYCFKNQEVGKEQYEKIIQEYSLYTYTGAEKARAEFEPIMNAHPRKATRMVNCVDCSGDLLTNCHNCKDCFLMLASENCRFDNYADGARDSYDTDAGGGSELAYESDLPAYSSNIIGSYSAWNCQNVAYVSQIYRSKNCLGCNGLKDAEYCILNKQYTKEEYFELVNKIKKHINDMPYIDKKGNHYFWGDYLPTELSCFPYLDTEAKELYPLTKMEINECGYNYSDKTEDKMTKETIKSEDLPDSIFGVTDDILKQIICSKYSNKKYKITEQELIFYRKYKIPLPRESFFERHSRRHQMASSFRLFNRKSDKSGEDITSSYPQSSKKIVWSVDEYKKEFE
jgi:hypothetical protein